MRELNQFEVLFFHRPGSDKSKSLEKLREVVSSAFEVLGGEFIDVGQFSSCRQLVMFRATGSIFYASILDMEHSIRAMAPEKEFPWKRLGGLPVR